MQLIRCNAAVGAAAKVDLEEAASLYECRVHVDWDGGQNPTIWSDNKRTITFAKYFSKGRKARVFLRCAITME